MDTNAYGGGDGAGTVGVKGGSGEIFILRLAATCSSLAEPFSKNYTRPAALMTGSIRVMRGAAGSIPNGTGWGSTQRSVVMALLPAKMLAICLSSPSLAANKPPPIFLCFYFPMSIVKSLLPC